MTFDADVKRSQTRWRSHFLPQVTERGTWRGNEYDHILPENRWPEGLWPDIAGELERYMVTEQVQRHTLSHHLNSSWVLAANLYFPFAVRDGGHTLMGSLLRSVLSLPVDEVMSIDLEFADPPPYDQATLLGEKGSRGSGMTSPDIGIRYRSNDDTRGIVLIEVKYTEKDFQTCSQYRKLAPPERSPCCDVSGLLTDPRSCPYLAAGRRYVERLSTAMRSADPTARPAECPATNAYQLFRQQALAESLVDTGAYGHALSVVAHPRANLKLVDSIGGRKPDEASLATWGSMFEGRSDFSTLEHETYVDYMAATDGPAWTRQWLRYVRDRYFPGQ